MTALPRQLAFALCLVALLAGACSSGSGKSATPTPQPASPGAGGPKATVAVRPSAGCSAAAAQPGATTQQITIAGAARMYRRYMPMNTANMPLPVVINIHGLGSNVDQQVQLTAFEPLADQQHFIVLSPQALNSPPRWDTIDHQGNADVAFITSMLDDVEASACVDQARVYSTGLSDGGIMSSLLACTIGDRIAAIGLVSGIERPDGCKPGRAVPVIVFWGKQDVILPFCGGLGPALVALFSGTPVAMATPVCPPTSLSGFPPVEDAVGLWTAADGCNAKPTITQAGSDVEEREFGGCDDGAIVRFYVVADGGHTWPGSELLGAVSKTEAGAAILGHTTDQVDATQLIWSFFTHYALPR